MHVSRRRLLAVAALAPWLRARAAAPERRMALVIGNGSYRVGVLKNPVNDAQAMGSTLRGLGFDVTLRENATLRQMIDSMRQFALSADSASVRLVYYAGHGLQLKGRNYLLPVDSEIQSEDEVAAKAADLTELVDRLGRSRSGINIVILDACRNNPFSGGEVMGPDGRKLKFRALRSPGLAPVDAPLGSIIAFSTAPGGVALDNPDDRNSLYTRHLIEGLKVPGLPIELVFKLVRQGVAKDTNRLQVPWESSSLTGDFCFSPAPGGACIAALR